MAGIYLHIPFCKKACHYCDFHFSTTATYQDRMVAAMLLEIDSYRAFIENNSIQTIYFGGGTPSILNPNQIDQLITRIGQYTSIKDCSEITLEANPDDISEEKLEEWKTIGINRFSMGVQSFHQKDLEYMNRAHSAQESIDSIKLINAANFDTYTIDLIYGMPLASDEDWRQNVQTAIELKVPHISAYALTVEENTALDHMIQKGKAKDVDEDAVVRQYKILVDTLRNAGYKQYELSNFCLEGKEAIHNGNYWKGEEYIGIGPSAHSQIDNKRIWNVSNNIKYMNGAETGEWVREEEELTLIDKFNEYIMVKLRTSDGVRFEEVERTFGSKFRKHIIDQIAFEKACCFEKDDNGVALTDEGKLLSNSIISNLFFVE